MKKIKIAYISHFSSLQMGGQRSTYYLMENLNRDVFEPVLICPENGEFSDKCSAIGINSIFINLYSIKPKNYFRLIKEYKNISNLINKLELDLLHIDRDADVVITNLAKKKTKAKTIWHIRVNNGNFFDRFNSKNSDGIIGVSEAAKLRVDVKYLDKYKTIYNGVDLNLFKPASNKSELREKLCLPDDKFILIFVGQQIKSKGIFDIIEALRILKVNNEDLPLTLLIGTAKNEYIKLILQEKIQEYGLNNYCLLKPQQNNIFEWMQAADALIIPSYPGSEGMPRVLYEAMACGCIAIGSNIDGIKEIIDEEFGILIEPGNAKNIATNISKIMKEKDLQAKLRLKGRQRAEELFDIKKHTNEIEKFYLSIMNKNDIFK